MSADLNTGPNGKTQTAEPESDGESKAKSVMGTAIKSNADSKVRNRSAKEAEKIDDQGKTQSIDQEGPHNDLYDYSSKGGERDFIDEEQTGERFESGIDDDLQNDVSYESSDGE